jgi:radical SAM superfamily enzyme YgiQ (UPF0313 family)
MRDMRVYLCDLTHTSQQIALNCMPLGIGCISTYSRLQLGESVDFELFKYPDDIAARSLQAPAAVVGFSNYTWNFDISYTLAAKIKEKYPETVIVFGGPNYPNEEVEQFAFLASHPVIDFYVFKEGEQAFAALLRALIDTRFDVEAVKGTVPRSCHFIYGERLVRGELIERLRSLAEIPSPYTEGALDKFFDGKLVPLLQTNRGCPFTCTFCVEGLTYYNKVAMVGPERVRAELKYIAEHYAGARILNIADSNFGMYKEDLEVAQAIAEVQRKHGWPEYIHVATGKNQKERVLKVASIINGALRLSGSVQSLDAGVLKNIKRNNIAPDRLMELAHQAADVGSNVYSEIILGLPGETKESHFRTIEMIVNAGFNYLRLYTLMMLPGTELADHGTRTAYDMQTRFRVLPRCFGSYPFGSETIHSVEIEEVCVATRDLSFEEYLECRLFHLTVEIFYNDRIFHEVVEFLKRHGVSVFSWLMAVHTRRSRFRDDLEAVYAGFYEETRREVWESCDELEAFAKRPETIRRYVSGELGSNLIFKYKALALFGSAESLHEAAYGAARDLLVEVAPHALERYGAYLQELQRFSECGKTDLMQTEQILERWFAYDFTALAARGFERPPDEFHRPEGIVHYFYHDRVQRESIAHHRRQYGDDVSGRARILAKVYVKHLYRKSSTTRPTVELEEGTAPVPVESRLY